MAYNPISDSSIPYVTQENMLAHALAYSAYILEKKLVYLSDLEMRKEYLTNK